MSSGICSASAFIAGRGVGVTSTMSSARTFCESFAGFPFRVTSPDWINSCTRVREISVLCAETKRSRRSPASSGNTTNLSGGTVIKRRVYNSNGANVPPLRRKPSGLLLRRIENYVIKQQQRADGYSRIGNIERGPGIEQRKRQEAHPHFQKIRHRAVNDPVGEIAGRAAQQKSQPGGVHGGCVSRPPHRAATQAG